MPKNLYKKENSKKFFTKNGKELKSYKDFNAVFSLQKEDEGITSIGLEEPLSLEQPEKIGNFKEFLNKKRNILIERTKKVRKQLAQTDKLKISMISLGVNAALLIAIVFLIANKGTSTRYAPRYSIFSAKPLRALAASSNLFGGDTRSATLDKVFEAYNCPLQGMGDVLVREADKYDIPYWLVAAISFQESSCGKNTPQVKIGGQEDVDDPNELQFEESYNAWGWGVWGTNIKTFDNWENGIETVSQYLGESFYSKGITDTCEIMRIYTPPSDGSWCRGVNYFGEMIKNYTSPTR